MGGENAPVFLDLTLRRNPELCAWAIDAHQAGLIPPNTWVIDLDRFKANARLLAQAGQEAGLRLYFMLKQVGDLPELGHAAQAAGLPGAVAVTAEAAVALGSAGVRVAHVGHLVQLPRALAPQVLALRPEVVTLFDPEQARLLADAAAKELGRARDGGARVRQPVLLRVRGAHDVFYPGQEGGIDLDDLLAAARRVEQEGPFRVSGVTSFPCLLFDEEAQDVRPTPNLSTLLRAATRLRRAGFQVDQINAPSNTSVQTVRLLAEAGATHGEPGHALTGSTPLHAADDQPELPAAVYVSEITHHQGDTFFTVGGGFYSRGHVRAAVVARRSDEMLDPARRLPAETLPAEHIDYHGKLRHLRGLVRPSPGDTALYAFRVQIFVTRANVATVSGLSSGRPQLEGLWRRGFVPWHDAR